MSKHQARITSMLTNTESLTQLLRSQMNYADDKTGEFSLDREDGAAIVRRLSLNAKLIEDLWETHPDNPKNLPY